MEAQLGQDWSHAHHGMTFTCVCLRAARLQAQPSILMPPPAQFQNCPLPRDARTGNLPITQKYRCLASSVSPAPLALSLAGFKWGEQRRGEERLPPNSLASSKGPSFPSLTFTQLHISIDCRIHVGYFFLICKVRRAFVCTLWIKMQSEPRSPWRTLAPK